VSRRRWLPATELRRVEPTAELPEHIENQLSYADQRSPMHCGEPRTEWVLFQARIRDQRHPLADVVRKAEQSEHNLGQRAPGGAVETWAVPAGVTILIGLLLTIVMPKLENRRGSLAVDWRPIPARLGLARPASIARLLVMTRALYRSISPPRPFGLDAVVFR